MKKEKVASKPYKFSFELGTNEVTKWIHSDCTTTTNTKKTTTTTATNCVIKAYGVSGYEFEVNVRYVHINCKHCETKAQDSYQIIVYGMCFCHKHR